MDRYDWDHAGATLASAFVMGLGLLVLVPRAPLEAASWAGMSLVLIAWVLLLYGASWRDRP